MRWKKLLMRSSRLPRLANKCITTFTGCGVKNFTIVCSYLAAYSNAEPRVKAPLENIQSIIFESNVDCFTISLGKIDYASAEPWNIASIRSDLAIPANCNYRMIRLLDRICVTRMEIM